MTASSKVSGVGARYAVVFPLAGDGLPYAPSSATTGYTGVEVEGYKTLTVNDAEPQRFSHYGNDRVLAQDSLPATTGATATMTTAVSSLTLDAQVEGNLIRTINGMKFRAVNSNDKGNEPLHMLFTYRQALDTDATSSTFGRKRQWEGKIVPSCRITPITPGHEQGIVDQSYAITPTRTEYAPWGEALSETNWGTTDDEFVHFVTDHHPRFQVFMGNGTINNWYPSWNPAATGSITVWIPGTATGTIAVTAVVGTLPYFQVTAGTVPNGTQIYALILTDAPGGV